MAKPEVGAHGKICCEVLKGEGVTVAGTTEEGVLLKFDDSEKVWPLGNAAVESGRFVEFETSSES